MSPPPPSLAAEIKPRLELALSAGKEAASLTLRYFQQIDLAVERKSDASPVTIADRKAEQLLRERISSAFSRDGIIGEEFGTAKGTSGFNWILDPIDGTKTFISGVPLFGTMVAVEHDERAVIGCVLLPALNEGVYAARGQGTWHWRGDHPPRQSHVSKKSKLADGLLLTSQVDTFAARGAAPVYEALQKVASITRTWGDCYGYVLVATGRAEVMIDPIMNIWDAAAVQPIVEEAGGSFTSWYGEPTIHAGESIGTNSLVLDEVLAILRRAIAV